MQISIKRKTNYGRTDIYICDKEQAGFVKVLTKKETVDKWDLQALKSMGHTILDTDADVAQIVR